MVFGHSHPQKSGASLLCIGKEISEVYVNPSLDATICVPQILNIFLVNLLDSVAFFNWILQEYTEKTVDGVSLCSTLFIANLGPNCTEDEMKQVLSQ